MSRLKPFIKTMGPLILAAWTLSIGASSANAGGTWKVKGSALTKELSPTVIVKETEGKDFTLSSKLFGGSFTILCTGTEFVGMKLSTSGRIPAGGKIKFTGCVTALGGKVIAACEPKNGGEKGVFSTEKLFGEIFLHEAEGLIRIEPEVGTKIAVLEPTTPELCMIPSGTPMFGKLTLRDPELGTELVDHLVLEGPLTRLLWIDENPEHTVVVKGSLILTLTGEHKGLAWSGVPD